MTVLYKSLLLIIVLSLTLSSKAQIKSGSISIGSGSTQMDLAISLNTNTSVVSFSITGPASRWFAYGFGASSMSTSAYTLIANVGSAIPKEYNQAYHAAPIFQSVQNLSTVVSTSSGGFKTYTFSRAMNTGDADDFVFTGATTSINIIWAYGSNMVMAQHQSRGTVTLTLSNSCNIPLTVLPIQYICSGDSALIFGEYESISGDYWDTLQTNIGCDSIIKQTLNVGQEYMFQLTDTVICQNDSIFIFNKWISQGGIYYDSLSTTQGCDSIYFINVSHILIDTQVFISNNQLNAAYAYADHYQWYNCNTNLAISGANSLSYQPVQNGSYKVVITSLGCVDSSLCHSINWVGINNANAFDIQLGPNPVISKLNITIPDHFSNSSIEIYSIEGQLIYTQKLKLQSNTLDLSQLATGMYAYRLYSNSEIISFGQLLKK